MPKAVGHYLRKFESMRSERTNFDVKWQLVSDYILPRRDFSITQRRNLLRPHRVVSAVATNANARLAAMLLSYWLDPTRPILSPNVKRGLAVAGRSTDLDDDGINYLGALAWNVYDHMLRPKARLRAVGASMLLEYCAFGNGVIWTGRKRGFGPMYNGRSLQSCWWSENEDGHVDTLYYKLSLPLYRVMQRWPDAARHWPNPDQSEMNLIEVLLCCEPREGGKPGAVGVAKPFEFTAIALDNKNVILEETGYDSFPYSVFRFNPLPGCSYAEGPGCAVLPEVMVLNHITEAIENSASQKATPPLAMPARMFGRTLDRRPGAMNAYNPAGLGLTRADQAILKLDFTGTVEEAVALRQQMTDDIELGYFTDWQRQRSAGDMTAEEVNAREGLRLGSMASIVAHLEEPSCVLGDRTMEVMLAEGAIPPAPNSVAGAQVDWEYAGPLQIAQMRGYVQSTLQLINARGLVAAQDAPAAASIDLEACLRVIHMALGAPPETSNSHALVLQARQQAAQEAAEKHAAEVAAQVGGAVRDGGQGVASLAGAMPQAANGDGAAPFAPAAPFQMQQAA